MHFFYRADTIIFKKKIIAYDYSTTSKRLESTYFLLRTGSYTLLGGMDV